MPAPIAFAPALLGCIIALILLLFRTLWFLGENQKYAASKHDRHKHILNETIFCSRMAYQADHGEQTNHNSDNLVHDWFH